MLYRSLILTIHRFTDPFPIFFIHFFSTDRIKVVDSLKLKTSSFVINIAPYVANLLVWVNNYQNTKVAGAGFLLNLTICYVVPIVFYSIVLIFPRRDTPSVQCRIRIAAVLLEWIITEMIDFFQQMYGIVGKECINIHYSHDCYW